MANTALSQPGSSAQAGELFLDRKAVAARWRVSQETVKRREADGTLRALHLPGGRLVRYRFSDVLRAEGVSL